MYADKVRLVTLGSAVLIGLAALCAGCGAKAGYVMTPAPKVSLSPAVKSADGPWTESGTCYVNVVDVNGATHKYVLKNKQECRAAEKDAQAIVSYRTTQAAAAKAQAVPKPEEAK